MKASDACQLETIECDVVIVGAGPAGLAAAIRLKQNNPDIHVIIVEKGREVGAHILSGAIMDPIAINQLLPDWQSMPDHPFKTAVKKDETTYLTKNHALAISHYLLPKMLSNEGNYIVSLGDVCRFLAKIAEDMGVEIFPGFSAQDIIIDDENRVVGIKTGDMGIDRHNHKTAQYTPGVGLLAKYVLIGEGARGSLAKKLIAHYSLDQDAQSQKYGLGLKELWKIDPKKHKEGLVQHFLGWPLDSETSGGAFIYHMADNLVSVGLIIHLNYQNPYLSPFNEFQRFKTHPAIIDLFEGGKRLSYGARAITEGGFQSVPKLTFPGGALIGCAAGFVNVARIKGSHNAILSGMAAANHVADALKQTRQHDEIPALNTAWQKGPIGQDLYKARNVKPLLERYNKKLGILLSGFDMWCQQIFKFSPFSTLAHQKADYKWLKPAKECIQITYPKADNRVTFDLQSSLYLANIKANENQPSHLKIQSLALQEESELEIYGAPSTRYCPAGVYEWAQGTDGRFRYVINSQNCIHCKTCDIKDPNQNIDWTCPEGGDGPGYPNM